MRDAKWTNNKQLLMNKKIYKKLHIQHDINSNWGFKTQRNIINITEQVCTHQKTHQTTNKELENRQNRGYVYMKKIY